MVVWRGVIVLVVIILGGSLEGVIVLVVVVLGGNVNLLGTYLGGRGGFFSGW